MILLNDSLTKTLCMILLNDSLTKIFCLIIGEIVFTYRDLRSLCGPLRGPGARPERSDGHRSNCIYGIMSPCMHCIFDWN